MPNSATREWSYSAGERGRNKVRAFDRGAKGMFVEWYEPGLTPTSPRKRVRLALGRVDREAAKQQADDIAARFGKAEPVKPAELTLATLFDMYEREVTPSKVSTVQAHDRRAFTLFLQAFGAARKPATLNRRDWDGYIRERRSGRLRPASIETVRAVRACPVARDLQLLRAVLNWACRAGDGKGGTLLEKNPLAGLELPREESPRRAVLTPAQYDGVLAAAVAMGPRAELFVILAHETGHRGASVRQIRWSDVDLEGKRIRWRGELDKIKNEHTTPLTEDAVIALKRERLRQDVIGSEGWIFSAQRGDRSRPMSAFAASGLWRCLARTAKLPAGARYGWHSLRRKFANDLRGAPLRDLRDLGGWKATQTIVDCYQQPSEAAMREALSSRRTPGEKAKTGTK